MPKHKKRPPTKIWAVIDAEGELFCTYQNSRKEAIDDAYGPRFYKGWTLVEYVKKSTKKMVYGKEK